MSTQPETIISKQIRKALEPYAVVFRGNVGTFKTIDNRFIDTGLPKGFTDLFGFRKSDGKMFFIEIKTERGRLREQQVIFADMVQQYPILYGVARSIDDALEILYQDTGLQFTTGAQQKFR